MARFASLGSSIAWYDGDDVDVLALQANFHRVRHSLRPTQPHMYGHMAHLFAALKPYYVSPDVLWGQLAKAQELWDLNVINKSTYRRPGNQTWSHRIEMQGRSLEAKQLVWDTEKHARRHGSSDRYSLR